MLSGKTCRVKQNVYRATHYTVRFIPFIVMDYEKAFDSVDGKCLFWKLNKGQLTDAFLCEPVRYFPVLPCNRLNYETIHIREKEMEYDGRPTVTAVRPRFC